MKKEDVTFHHHILLFHIRDILKSDKLQNATINRF